MTNRTEGQHLEEGLRAIGRGLAWLGFWLCIGLIAIGDGLEKVLKALP